jgi:Flp pilus assembly protein TadG
MHRFAADRSGAIVLLFGLTLVLILGFVGGAIDYANAYRYRAKIQNTLDSAALAAGREIDVGSSNSTAKQVAQDVFKANLGPGYVSSASMNLDIDDGVVTANADLNVDTQILGVLGISQFQVGATSKVNVSGGTFEVALVLDNSGSMSGSRISDLKTASVSLTDILFGAKTTSNRVSMSVVPFSASVNVETQHSTAAWMDQTGQSSIHKEHFDSNVTRWQMFSALNNVSWAGCVETRPTPNDVTDTPATGGDTMFVPLFAPDEPNKSGYKNNYISDDNGNCPEGTSGGTNDTRQRRTCKYYGENASTSNTGATRKGPNHMCDSQSLTTLTNTKSTVQSAINSMVAKGYTNIHHGIMWGWRSLSPDAPLDEGKPYNEPYHAKIMIVMTDGANTFPTSSKHNQSWYSSYGFHKQGRLGASSNSTSSMRSAMNGKTALSCTNAKAAGIIIYTIAFSISDPTTVNMLRDCATSPAYALTINNGSALVATFEAIAHDINKLRISG